MSRRLVMAALAALVAALTGGQALAHKPSDSYLKISVNGARIEGQWDIALRDLDYAIGLDLDQDNAVTWGEVKAKHADIAAYALSRLTLGPPGAPCAAEVNEHLIDSHSDGAYAVLRFAAACPAAPADLEIGYRLFFDVDPTHRGLVSITAGASNQAGILSAASPVQRFPLAGLSWRAQLADYFRDGVLHIWDGFDHMLFILALLFPVLLATGAGADGGRVPGPPLIPALKTILKVVTAFTAAHALTLSLASAGVIGAPTRIVEPAIALTVVLAALNNIRPVARAGGWPMAFCFGLIHGFGFAAVIGGLGLSKSSLLVALVGFNVGVEAGQLGIVALFLPVAYALGYTHRLRRALMLGGSAAVALIGAIWFVQRAFNVVLVPALGA